MLHPAESEIMDFMAATPEAEGLPIGTAFGFGARADARLGVSFYNRPREVKVCDHCSAAKKFLAPQGLDGLLLVAQNMLPQGPKVEPHKPGTPCCTETAGRPIFVEVVYVRIHDPGDPLSITDREARVDPKKVGPEGQPGDFDAKRFPRHWAAFLAKRDQTIAAGTPLSVLVHTQPPVLTVNQVEELKHLPQAPIHTVEQLAEMTDVVASRYHGFMTLREQARRYLAATRADAPMVALQTHMQAADRQAAENKQLIQQQGEVIRKLQEQIAQLNVGAQKAVAASATSPAASAQEPVAPSAPPAGLGDSESKRVAGKRA